MNRGFMFTYKNISNFKLAININNKIVYVKPYQTISSNSVIYNNFLIDVTEYPNPVFEKKEIKKQIKTTKLGDYLNDS